MFKEKMLDVITKFNTNILNYVNVIFNSNNDAYKKTNNKTKYIRVDSDHPPSIIKQIPKSIAARLSSLSLSKEMTKVE